MSVKESIPSSLYYLSSTRSSPLSGLCRCCKQPSHIAHECGQAWGQPNLSSSASVPSPSSFPVDPDPDPVAAIGFEDNVDLCSVSSDHPDLSYPSLTVEHIPCRPRTKHTKRLAQPTAFPFSSPKVPVLPKSKAVLFCK